MEDFANFVRDFWGLWLMLIFIGIIAWTFWPGRRRKLEKHGEIPLKDDDDDTPGGNDKENP